jgi:hypothetical protein
VSASASVSGVRTTGGWKLGAWGIISGLPCCRVSVFPAFELEHAYSGNQMAGGHANCRCQFRASVRALQICSVVISIYWCASWGSVGVSAYKQTAKNCTLPYTEYAALESLFNACNGNSWNWEAREPLYTHWTFPAVRDSSSGGEYSLLQAIPCSYSWQGVTCKFTSSSNSSSSALPNCTIVGIDLQSKNLQGALPSAIGQFTSIQTLVLASNNLTNTIPTSLGLLTNLYDLEMSYNEFNGSLPLELFRLTDLRYLMMSSTHLTGKNQCASTL